MTVKKNYFLLIISILFGINSFAQINPVADTARDQVGIYEHLDKYILDDIQLIDKDSTLVSLKSLIDKK